MKNKVLLIISLIVVLSVGSFFILKWDQLQYYFKSGNTEIVTELVNVSSPEINLNESNLYTFEVKNVGSNPLLIKNVLTECECVVVSFDKNETDCP